MVAPLRFSAVAVMSPPTWVILALHGTKHAVVQDRIEAGTFMVAAAMTSGDVLIKDAIWEHNRPLITSVSVPAPLTSAPISLRRRAKSTISGSRAAFSMVVTPSAKVAAIIRF